MSYFDAIEFIQCLALSFGVSILVVGTKKYHLAHSSGGLHRKAVQTSHLSPTPRVGGVAIVLALLVALLVFAPAHRGTNWPYFALSLAPIFLAGLAEDLGFGISPRGRLLAAAASSAICIAVLGIWIPRADVPLVDYLFAFAPFAILFTIFAASGVCHAFNLIDGVNGLAAGVGVITAFGISAIAARSDQSSIGIVAFLMIPAILGFLLLNYPFGKIFLGDSGAYSIGHVLAWFSIALLARVETLTTWAILLVLFWPVADTTLAIFRRARSGKPTDRPDRLHFHQLVMRTLEIVHFGRRRRHIANPLTTAVILPLAAAPMIAGVLLWNRPLAAFAAYVLFSVLFFLSYFLCLRFAAGPARRLRRARGVAVRAAGPSRAGVLAGPSGPAGDADNGPSARGAGLAIVFERRPPDGPHAGHGTPGPGEAESAAMEARRPPVARERQRRLAP